MKLPRRSVAALVLFTALPLAVAAQRAADRFELVLADGRVIDLGTWWCTERPSSATARSYARHSPAARSAVPLVAAR